MKGPSDEDIKKAEKFWRKPSVGRVVHYVLSADDLARLPASNHRNPHVEGQHVPMVIVVVWPNEHGPNFDGVNGQVLLDGDCSLWVTSAREGTKPGTWHWPEPISG